MCVAFLFLLNNVLAILLRAPFRYKMACGVQFLRCKVMENMAAHLSLKHWFKLEHEGEKSTHLWRTPTRGN